MLKRTKPAVSFRCTYSSPAPRRPRDQGLLNFAGWRDIWKIRGLFGFALVWGVLLAAMPACAQDRVTVTSCPGQERIPVAFEVDCTHIGDAGSRRLCRAFAENQACKVAPAYRQITGVHLEQRCPVMRYNLFEKENWPFPNSRDAGGLAGKCEISLLSDYSLQVKSRIGPYDLHELLHEHQAAMGPFLNEHPMFDPAQAEAARLIGDPPGAAAYVNRMRHEIEQARTALLGAREPSAKTCGLAQTYVEDSLYLQEPRNVYAFYRKLGPLPPNPTRQELAARENRMLYVVSYGKDKEFLMTHGCWAF